jgi:putative salt-induced outer membrane protein YdiY
VNKLLSCSLLCLAAPCALAITNIENDRPSLPKTGVSGSAQVGLDGKTGNQKEANYSAASKLFYRTDSEIFMLIGARAYGKTNNLKDTDETFLHSRWTHLLSSRWALESFAQWQQNEFENLNARLLAGAGGRYLIAQEEGVYSLAVGLGAFREKETLDLISYNTTQYFWRGNSYYSYKYRLNKTLSVVNTTYLQPNLDDTQDYRMLFDLGVSLSLSNNLSLKFNYKLTHDSRPAQNLASSPPLLNKKTNSAYETSLSFNF